MRIKKVGIVDFRNIKRADLDTDSPFVIIAGHNAAGKTSLLEALYLALAGRSFRTREWSKLIHYDAKELLVTVSNDKGFVGAARQRGVKPQHRMNGEDVALSCIAKQFPIQLFDSSLFDLFEGASSCRRQLIDWLLFHVKQEFYPVWRTYYQALKQRNALLKEVNSNMDMTALDSWDKELVKQGVFLSELRRDYTESLLLRCQKNMLLSEINLDITYYKGWSNNCDSLEDALKDSRSRDIKYKRTTLGPHTADLKITANTKKAGDNLSRGQKKLAAFAIKLEQVKMYNEEFDSSCLILCDDFTAELDRKNQAKILQYISELKSQVFMTVIESETILPLMPKIEDKKVFHVKQGKFLT